MKSQPRYRMQIDDSRIPAIKGLPDDVVHMLHQSFVHIVRMRRSIESADAHIDRSWKAILETEEMLKRLNS